MVDHGRYEFENAPPVIERLERWVRASHGLAPIESHMTIVLQGLGRVDCRLIPEDKQFLQLSQEERETIEQSISMSDRFTYSYLWVLGAYELVRTLDQRCHADPALLGNNLTTRVRELKHSMERLRMPLAKMETANRYPSDDSIAWPSIHPITVWLGGSPQVSSSRGDSFRTTFLNSRRPSEALEKLRPRKPRAKFPRN